MEITPSPLLSHRGERGKRECEDVLIYQKYSKNSNLIL
jgi:hypothetical protein